MPSEDLQDGQRIEQQLTIRNPLVQSVRGEAGEGYPPLTKAQLAAIRKHEPKRKGRVLSSLLK